jgi:hypothetical protein
MNVGDTSKILVCIDVHKVGPYSCWRCMQKYTVGLCCCLRIVVIRILAIHAEMLASVGVHLK